MSRYEPKTDLDPRLFGMRMFTSPLIERGKVLIVGDGDAVYVGTGLCRGVPYRIRGLTKNSYGAIAEPIVVERCYVLVDAATIVDVLDATTGKVHSVWDYRATEVPR